MVDKETHLEQEKLDIASETTDESHEETGDDLIQEDDGKLGIQDILAHLAEQEQEVPEEEIELTPLEQIVEFIKENSTNIRLTRIEEFAAEPFSFDSDTVEKIVKDIETIELFQDIKILNGAETRYFYWEEKISRSFATMMMRVEEKDLLKMIAETVREETKGYRRPFKNDLLLIPPFNLSQDQLHELLQLMKLREEYQDIKEVKASNRAEYLFSDQYMTERHAKSLVEWQEVERFENP